MIRKFTAFALLFAVTTGSLSHARAQDAASSATHNKIEKYLSPATVVVGWLDITQPDSESVREFAKNASLPEISDTEIERLEAVCDALIGMGVQRVYWISDLPSIWEGPMRLAIPCENPAAVKLLVGSLLPKGEEAVAEVDGNVVLVGNKAAQAGFREAKGEASAELKAAMADIQGPHGLAFSTTPGVTMTLFTIIQSAMDDISSFVKAAEALSGAKWASISTDLDQNVSIALLLDSEENATKLRTLVSEMLNGGDKSAIAALLPEQHGATLKLVAKSEEQIAAKVAALKMLTPFQGAREMQIQNNLKQVALALHNYHSAYQHFPGQSLVDEKGQRLLSWRVLILPFLEQATLYEQFRLDEPWDSEHNLKAAAAIPATYAMTDQQVDEHGIPMTQVLAPMTKQSIFGRPGAPVNFRDITDGTSNTIWFLNAPQASAVAWSKPEDLVVDVNDPAAAMVDAKAKEFSCAFVDGSVHSLSAKTKKQVLNALLTIDGGEVIDFDELNSQE